MLPVIPETLMRVVGLGYDCRLWTHTFFTCLRRQMRLLLFGLFHSPIS